MMTERDNNSEARLKEYRKQCLTVAGKEGLKGMAIWGTAATTSTLVLNKFCK